MTVHSIDVVKVQHSSDPFQLPITRSRVPSMQTGRQMADSIASTASAPKPNIPSISTQPPPLPLNLHQHKKSIALQWSALLIATCILPEVLYFGLRYSSHTKDDVALTPPTAILCVFSIATIGLRAFKLLRKGSTKRPLGGKWWAMDYFQWNLIMGFIIVTAVLVESTGEDPPDVRTASLPQTIVLYVASVQVLITALLSSMGWSCPIRMSSAPAGAAARPGVYVLMEDVCSVDGSGGQEFRRALQTRYEASPIFRRMIAQLNWFWGVGSLLVAIGMTVLIEVVDDLNIVYALGWSIPWVWAALGTIATITWARMALQKERASWNTAV